MVFMGVGKPLYKTRSKQGSEEKWQNCSNVYKKIYKQFIEGSLGYCANGPMGASSNVSKTRSNLGIEVKLGGLLQRV